MLDADECSTSLRWRGFGLEAVRRLQVEDDKLRVETTLTSRAAAPVPYCALEHVSLGLEVLDPVLELHLPAAPTIEVSVQEGPVRAPADAPHWPIAKHLDGSTERVDRVELRGLPLTAFSVCSDSRRVAPSLRESVPGSSSRGTRRRFPTPGCGTRCGHPAVRFGTWPRSSPSSRVRCHTTWGLRERSVRGKRACLNPRRQRLTASPPEFCEPSDHAVEPQWASSGSWYHCMRSPILARSFQLRVFGTSSSARRSCSTCACTRPRRSRPAIVPA